MNTNLRFHRSGTGPAGRRAGRAPSLPFSAIHPSRQPAIPDEGRSPEICRFAPRNLVPIYDYHSDMGSPSPTEIWRGRGFHPKDGEMTAPIDCVAAREGIPSEHTNPSGFRPLHAKNIPESRPEMISGFPIPALATSRPKRGYSRKMKQPSTLQRSTRPQATFHAIPDHDRNRANGPMQLIPVPSGLSAYLLLNPLRGQEECRKQAGIPDRGR